MDPYSVKKESTGKSGLALALIGVVIVAVIGITAWILYSNPDILENVLYVILVIIAAIVIVIIAVWIITAVLAVPYYIAKGESYQDDASYNLDDVSSAGEVRSDGKKE
jgi:uncharacterized membrane protein